MKKTVLLALCCAATTLSFSQQFVGYNFDNYAGVNSVLMNPSMVAHGKYKVNVNLFSISLLGGNNMYEVDHNRFKHFDFNDMSEGNGYTKSTNTDSKNLWFNTDIIGPSFLVTTGKRSGFAITTRMRTIINEFNLSNSTFQLFGTSNPAFYNLDIQEKNVQAKAHAFADAGLTYGRIVYSNGHSSLRAGVTAKYVIGLATGSAYSDQMLVNIAPSRTINKLNGMASVQYSNNFDNINGDNLDDALRKRVGKGGWGFDIGLTYQWRPAAPKHEWVLTDPSPYILRVGMALTDLGAIKYDNSPNGKTYLLNGTGRPITDLQQKDNETFDQYFQRLQTLGIITQQSQPSTLKVKLPTALRTNVDWHIFKRVFINFDAFMNMVGKANNPASASYISTFSVTPRLEKKWYSVYMPVNYNMQKKLAWGAGFRLGPVFAGSGSILSNFFGNKNISNADFHMGLNVPIFQHGRRVKMKVSEEPPADEPKEVIKETTKDRDGDGVVDEKDECPDTPGVVKLAGCPDKDGDGVADKNDKCPDTPGSVKYNGCPVPDTDGDGINDEEDKCPQVKGTAKYNGCPIPDTDGDGVNDEEDKCPFVRGTVANHGCPEIKTEVAKKVSTAAKSVFFMTARDIIMKKSFAKLDTIVKVLKADPSLKLTIEGHTDNVGTVARNQHLSERRAEAIKIYLIKKGIPADRLIAQGFGSSKPVASNKTAAGRAKNRRVEMRLSNW